MTEVYTATVWHGGRQVLARLHYEISFERGYRISFLRGIEEIDSASGSSAAAV